MSRIAPTTPRYTPHGTAPWVNMAVSGTNSINSFSRPVCSGWLVAVLHLRHLLHLAANCFSHTHTLNDALLCENFTKTLWLVAQVAEMFSLALTRSTQPIIHPVVRRGEGGIHFEVSLSERHTDTSRTFLCSPPLTWPGDTLPSAALFFKLGVLVHRATVHHHQLPAPCCCTHVGVGPAGYTPSYTCLLMCIYV